MAAFDRSEVAILSLSTKPREPVRPAANRLAREAVAAAEKGARLIILDDGLALHDDRGWIPPHLAVALVDKALRANRDEVACPDTCRRSTGLVVHSAAIRNLHDIIVALGLGADAIAPYLLIEVAAGGTELTGDADRAQRISRTLHALRAGIEKITSTMGIHELRGYGRIFSTIGVSNSLAEVLMSRASLVAPNVA